MKRFFEQKQKILSLLRAALGCFCIATVDFGSVLASENAVPAELRSATITERLGAQVDLDSLQFKGEDGVSRPLRQYWSSDRPTLLTFVYYQCPNLCTLVLNGMLDALNHMDWTVGKEINLISLSIDHRETPELARAKKDSYLKKLKKGDGSSWHFLTGDELMIKKLADTLGFGYRYDPEQKQFAHSAGVFVMTPEGLLSRVAFGVQFQPKDLRLALTEAASGKIGTVIDRIILFCYRYDPMTRKYSLWLTRLMQVAGGLTVLIMGLYLGLFWWKQTMQKSVEQRKGAEAT